MRSVVTYRRSDFAHMPNADYYRRQAEVFRRLAQASHDRAIAERFNMMVRDFTAKAKAAERSDDPDTCAEVPDLHVIGDDPSGGDMDRD